MFKIIAFFIITLFARLYVKVDILLTCVIFSSRGEVWAHKTSLTLPLIIEVPVQGAIMSLWVKGINFASFYDFAIGTVSTSWYFCFSC